MRKIAMLIAVAMAVTAPSMAYAAKKKAKAKPAATTASKPVDNSKFFRDAAHQFIVPFESLAGKQPATEAKAKPAKKGKKAKKSSKKKSA